MDHALGNLGARPIETKEWTACHVEEELRSVGEIRGAAPGTRFAIYRNVNVAGLPLAAVGEAIVVFADPETSVVRLTRVRDAIYSGDLLIPRRR